MKSLRILMAISSFRPVIGGGEQQAERIARALVQRGHSATVLTRWSRRDVPHTEIMDGVCVVRVPAPGRWGYTVRMLWWVWRNRTEFDVIHAQQSLSPLVVACLASLVTGLPVVCTPMSWVAELSWIRRPIAGSVKRFLYRRVTCWISKSNEIAKVLSSYVSEENVERIPNGVDTEIYKPVDRAPSSGDVPTVIFVARLQKPKRLDILLQAWTRLTRPARLLVVGDGVLRSEWGRQSAAIDGVSFLGNRNDVPFVLQEATIFVLLSDSEGMPNALLEAMSCGLACVASGVGAIPDMLSDGVGVVVPNEVEAVAGALNELLSNDSLRREYGHRARNRILSHYSLNLTVTKIEGVYRRVLKMEE